MQLPKFDFTLCLLLFSLCVLGQQQDPNLNNLVLPKEYPLNHNEELTVSKNIKEQARNVIVVSGWGFGKTPYNTFIESLDQDFSTHFVTIPGFDNTAAHPLSKEKGRSYGDQAWTTATVDALIDHIETNKISEPVVIGHFITGVQVAFRLALKRPDLVDKLVLVSGSAKVGSTEYIQEPTLQERILINDTYYAPKWFKTVTKNTWDEQNYPPELYATDTTKAQELWQVAASVPISIMIQYILEYYASDISLDFKKLKVPTLVMQPSFNEALFEKYNYLKPSFVDSWSNVKENTLIQRMTIPNSRFFMMLDQPAVFKKTLNKFLNEY